MEKFDSSGNYLSQFGSSGTGNGQFNKPFGVAVYPDGLVGVVDSNNKRVRDVRPEWALRVPVRQR